MRPVALAVLYSQLDYECSKEDYNSYALLLLGANDLYGVYDDLTVCMRKRYAMKSKKKQALYDETTRSKDVCFLFIVCLEIFSYSKQYYP